MKRVEGHWYKILDPQKVTVALDAQGCIAGYALAAPPRTPPLYVHEAAATSLETYQSLLAHFAGQAAKNLQPELELRIPPAHPLMQYAETLGGRFTMRLYQEGEGQAMLRIIYLPQALEQMTEELEHRLQRSSLRDITTGLNIQTDLAGTASLDIQKGKVRVIPQPNPHFPTLEIPQNLLTRSLIGYWSVKQLQMRMPALELRPEIEELFAVLFPKGFPLTCEADYF